jgi:hypothetical protein
MICQLYLLSITRIFFNKTHYAIYLSINKLFEVIYEKNNIEIRTITFATLWFLGRALQNDKNAPDRDLCYGHPTNYNVCDLSHRRYFSKLLIFSTSVT